MSLLGRACFPVALCFLVGCNEPSAPKTSAGPPVSGLVAAVYSRASNDYSRAGNPGGSFLPETYVLKDGGDFGGPRVDDTVERLNFEDVSAVIAAPLARVAYAPSEDPAATSLLIVVYWGTTVVPGDARANPAGAIAGAVGLSRPAGMDRDAGDAQSQSVSEAIRNGWVDAENANILGYTDAIFRTRQNDPRVRTLQDELGEGRYYVVLMAYDYQAARKFGRHSLLWETRLSVPARGNDFRRVFPAMMSVAARYFGEDSNGLVHLNLGDGRVEAGEPTAPGAGP
jgi:hypothetical protein